VAERTFALEAAPPFRLDLTAWALRRRTVNTVDVWDGAMYRRTLELGGAPVALAVAQTGPPVAPALSVTLAGARVDRGTERAARAALARLLGLEVELEPFYRLARGDPLLAELAARFRGLKPPRFPTLFECLVNAIACQQLTLTVGLLVLDRLAATYGATAGGGDRGQCAFPSPARLAGLAPEDLRPLGFSTAKARSVIELAAAVCDGAVDLEALAALDDAAALAALQRLRGVGRWSAEYALLRGLGRLHVFPGDDVGARNNLARTLGLSEPLDYTGVQAAVRPWRPFAGLAYFHLLLASIECRELECQGAGASACRLEFGPA
jgi:DNA-3-methyladenine glycosylase II